VKQIHCDGGCSTQWPESALGTIRGPSVEIKRVDGMGGGGYLPNAGDALHLCRDCAASRLAWTAFQGDGRG
jgi:hypothetical protein